MTIEPKSLPVPNPPPANRAVKALSEQRVTEMVAAALAEFDGAVVDGAVMADGNGRFSLPPEQAVTTGRAAAAVVI